MIEADVWRSIISVLRSGLDGQGFTDIAIRQAYQPVKQGPSDKSVYLHKINSSRVGHQARNYQYNPVAKNYDEVEKYWLAVTIQLTAIISQDIYDSNSITSYDLVDLCAAILQTRVTRQALLDDDISIERIGQIPVSFSLDDRDQFDLDPSFDFTLLYEQVLTLKAPRITSFDVEIIRI